MRILARILFFVTTYISFRQEIIFLYFYIFLSSKMHKQLMKGFGNGELGGLVIWVENEHGGRFLRRKERRDWTDF